MKTKEELNALKEEVEALNKKLAELTEEELEKVAGGDSGGMNIGKEPPANGLSSLSLPDMVAELEKRGFANLKGAVASPGGGASQLINEGRGH